MKRAFLFDLNGTMIDDMDFHVRAWYDILNELGAELSITEVKHQCYGKNDELLERIFPGRFSSEEMSEMSYRKERAYQQAFLPSLRLIPGLGSFLDKAKTEGIPMAIGSAAIMFNIDFVLDGLSVRNYFTAIVSADDVTISKPDPETFIKCANALNVDPANCIVFEDAPKGVEAAGKAGMKAVVLTTMHEKDEFGEYDNVLCFVKDYTDPQLQQLFI